MREGFEYTLYYIMQLASWSLVEVVQRIGYMDAVYSPRDLQLLKQTAEKLSAKVADEIFGKEESISRARFQ